MVRRLIAGEDLPRFRCSGSLNLFPAKPPDLPSKINFLNSITDPKRFGWHPKRFGSTVRHSLLWRCLMSDSIIRLQSAGADVVIKTRPFAEIIYWGPHLSHFSPQDADSLTRPVANGSLDVDSPVTLMAELGHGLFGAPGIEGHRQGLDASDVHHQRSAARGPDADPGQRRSAGRPASAQRDRAGCQRRAERAPWRDQSARQPMAGGSPGGHAAGRRTRSRGDGFPWPLDPRVSASPPDLEHDSFVLENRRGRTSHEHFPALITGSRAFSEMQGEVWGVHLAWSGNHRLRAEVKTDGRRYLQAEALYLPGEMALAEGETLWTPYLYASYSANGLNGMSQQFHRYLRERIIRFPGNKPRPVHLNTWEGSISTTTRTTSCAWRMKRRRWASSALSSMTAGLKGATTTGRRSATGISMRKNTPTA
jgi:alpha-galactosidase